MWSRCPNCTTTTCVVTPNIHQRETETEKDAVIHIDFLENYNTKYSSEVLLFHFGLQYYYEWTILLQYALPLTIRGDEKVQVCREMFLNTLSLGSFTVQNWLKKVEFCVNAHPELLNSLQTLTLTEEVKTKMQGLNDFFNKLLKMPSYYAQK